jgi:glycosyltransferase involved in cell wall biosynthesis
MRVGLITSSNKFTGAAAVTEHWCRALHTAGHEAQLLFVGGANLERRLASAPWAHPDLVKERRPADIRSNFAALRRLGTRSDIVLTSLPHDHLEAVLAGVPRQARLVRAFRNPRHLRRDPLHQWAARKCAAALAPFNELEGTTRRLVGDRPTTSIPVPVEDRFRPGPAPPEARHRLGIDPTTPLIGMVGKMAKGRGFEILLDAAAKIQGPCGVLAVGHGELQPILQRQAQKLGILDRVIWAGKHEEDLPLHFSAMDALVFAAPGSDWGHRAISEAQACGRPVITLSFPGVEDLVDHEHNGLIVEDTPAITAAFNRLVEDPNLTRRLSRGAIQSSIDRRFEVIGRRLGIFLEALGQHPGFPDGGTS